MQKFTRGKHLSPSPGGGARRQRRLPDHRSARDVRHDVRAAAGGAAAGAGAAALLEPAYRLDACAIERLRAAEHHLLAGGIETDTADQLHDRGVRFHESLVEASGNAFFIDTIRRVNRVRRLLSYRSMQHRERYPEHARQHLHILDLLARERNEAASDMMRAHLRHTLDAITNIASILEP
uniref:GntR C-terminal domain-containing protein n=1 Tax=Ralstonia solanacearum TaxID=305 RepID=A0A0S4V7N2_RALSL|nr:protein of unknown function [Ralstonia solanacearum]